MYIGQIPNRMARGMVELDEHGYIVTDGLLHRSAGLACGDARANPLKQIAMAVGEETTAVRPDLDDLAGIAQVKDGRFAGAASRR